MRRGIASAVCLVGIWGVVVAARAEDGKAPPGGSVPTSDHWAYRPVVRPALPSVDGACRSAVDRFIVAALEARKSRLNPEADRVTLIRRVSFDLTGLPPTLAEIDAFLVDRSPHAYERMVDRYLASPHYGEHWGKHWLDAAGYADSNGYFNADTDRPLAWRYRDYVIARFQPRHTLQPVRHAAARRRRTHRLHSRWRRHSGHGRCPDGDTLPPQCSGWIGGERRQPRRGADRPLHRVGREPAKRHELSARRHHPVRPLPQP